MISIFIENIAKKETKISIKERKSSKRSLDFIER